MSRSHVCTRQNTEKFKKAIKEAFQEPIDIIENAMKRAARVMTKGLYSKDERIAQNAARILLVSKGIIKERGDAGMMTVQPPTVIVLEGLGKEVHIGNTGQKMLPVVDVEPIKEKI